MRETAVPAEALPHTAASRVVEAVRCYSVREAAERIGMSRGWLYGQIGSGQLRVVEFGDTRAHTRVRADDLQRFIDERTHGRR